MLSPFGPPIVTFTMLAAVIGCAAASQTPSSPSTADGPLPVIVALGDSVTAGFGLKPEQSYPALLQQKLTMAGYRYRVVNAGVSGDTTADALRRVDRALVPDTRMLIIALGANDGLRGLPPAQVEANLAKIIEAAQARGLDVLLLTMEAPPHGGFEYTLAFHRVFTALAARYQVPRVPFVLIDLFGNPSLTLPDRLHPSAAGQRVIADLIWPYLEPMVKGR